MRVLNIPKKAEDGGIDPSSQSDCVGAWAAETAAKLRVARNFFLVIILNLVYIF